MPGLAAPHGVQGSTARGSWSRRSRDETRRLHEQRGYKTRPIIYESETKAFKYDCGIKLPAGVMNVGEAGVLDCFVATDFEHQRTQAAPEADSFTFFETVERVGVTPKVEDFSDADAEDVLTSLCSVTNAMGKAELTTGGRALFITLMLKGVLTVVSGLKTGCELVSSGRLCDCLMQLGGLPTLVLPLARHGGGVGEPLDAARDEPAAREGRGVKYCSVRHDLPSAAIALLSRLPFQHTSCRLF